MLGRSFVIDLIIYFKDHRDENVKKAIFILLRLMIILSNIFLMIFTFALIINHFNPLTDFNDLINFGLLTVVFLIFSWFVFTVFMDRCTE